MKSRTIADSREPVFHDFFHLFLPSRLSDEHLSVIMRRVYPRMINIYARNV